MSAFALNLHMIYVNLVCLERLYALYILIKTSLTYCFFLLFVYKF